MAQESRLVISIDSREAEKNSQELADALAILEKLGVRVTASTVKVGKAAEGAGTNMRKAGSDARTGASGVDRFGKSIEGVKSSASSLRGVLTGAFVGVSIAGAIGKVITETKNFEQEQAQLAAVLKSTGGAAGFSREQLNEMAAAMSSASLITSGEINQAQTTLLAFTGIVGGQFKDALQAAIDMSARTGMSVVSAAETIGRALDVPSQGLTALSRQGFRFTEEQKKLAEKLESTGKAAEAQGIILSALKDSYGGAASAARDTFGGSLVGLQNTISDLMSGDDGSLDGAKRAVQQLTATLRSEETKQAFATFVSLVAGATNKFANFMEVAGAGSLFGWVLTSGREARNAEKEITKLEGSLAEIRGTLKTFQDSGEESAFMRWYHKDDVLILNGQIAATEEKLKALRVIAEQNRRAAELDYVNNGFVGPMPAPTTLGTITVEGGGVKPDKSKKAEISEGQRYINQINERISLIGKETELERLQAQISIGAIKFKTDAKRKEAEAAAKAMDKANASLRLTEMQREIDMIGLVTEADKMRYEVSKGLYAGFEPDIKKHLVLLAAESDEKSRQIDFNKTLLSLQGERADAERQFFREIEAFGRGDQYRGLLDSLAQVEDKYRQIMRERRNSPAGLSAGEQAAIEQARDAELERERERYAERLALQADWVSGATRGLENYFDAARNVSSGIEGLFGNAFSGMEDALTAFVRTGKASFSDLANSIIEDMVRITIQQSITGPLASALGGALGSAFGSMSSNWSSTNTSNPWSLSSLGVYDIGGYTGDGGRHDVAGLVHKGEGILNQDEIRAIGGEDGFNALRKAIRTGHSIGGMAGRPSLPLSAGATQPNINVNLHGVQSQPESVTATRNQSGGFDIDIMFKQVEKRMASNVASGQGSMSKALERRYALTPQLG